MLEKRGILEMPHHSFQKVLIEPVVLPKKMALSELFAHISHLDMAILLDSASTRHEGRYSIMLWAPFKVIRSKKGHTTIYEPVEHTSTHSDVDPFDTLKRVFDEYYANVEVEPSSNTEHLPFYVGMAGFSGYDVARYYETLPSHATDDYSCDDLAVGCYEQALIEDTHSNTFYHCRFDHVSPFDINAFVQVKQELPPLKLTGKWQSNLSKQQYCSALDAISNYLRAGDCYQVNMAQRFSAPYSGDPYQGYLSLREHNQAPFSAFVRSRQSAILSISPERFLKVDRDGNVESKPIKGTRPRSENAQKDALIAESLLSSEKDRAENLMIVDLLRNDISKHCQPHSVKVPALFALETYPAVHHMVSTVVGQLDTNATPLDLLKGAFPGGSITGAPKIRAMEIIDELEPHRRNIYCGSVFYYGVLNDFDSSICIRTVLAENGQLHCWAGGGIVLDSEPHSEYQETLDKVKKILPVLTSTLNA